MNAPIKLFINFLGLLTLIFLCCFCFFYNLGNFSISATSDEVIYTRVTQSLIQDKHWFPVYHGSAPLLEKPPLRFWLGGIFPYLFGESNLNFRLFDALCGVSSVGLTVLLSYLLTSSLAISLAGGILLFAAPEWIISEHSFRRVVLDGLLTVFILLSALFTWQGVSCFRLKDDSWVKYVTLTSLSCGFGAWTKSVAGLVPLISILLIFATLELTRKDFKALLIRLAIAPAMFLIYLVLLYLAQPQALKTFIGVEIFDRVTHGFTGHNSDKPFFYFWYLFVRGGILSPLLLVLGTLASLHACFFSKNKSQRILFQFLLCFSYIPVILFSLASSRVAWYLNPYVPFFIILSLAGTIYLFNLIPEKKILLSVSCLILLFYFGLSSFTRALARNIRVVQSQSTRIELDQVVEEILKTKSQVVLVKNTISGKTSPEKGRFNVEGIYRKMLKPRMQVVENVNDIEISGDKFYFVRESEVKILSERAKLNRDLHVFARLEKTRLRNDVVLVLK